MPTSNTSGSGHTPLTDQQMFDAIQQFLLTCPVTAARTATIAKVVRLQEADARRKRILGLVQEALAQLRLDMKYLVFDLEATTRERNALQKELNRRNGS